MSRDVGWTRPRGCLPLRQDSQRPRRHQYVRHSTVRTDILEENMTTSAVSTLKSKVGWPFDKHIEAGIKKPPHLVRGIWSMKLAVKAQRAALDWTFLTICSHTIPDDHSIPNFPPGALARLPDTKCLFESSLHHSHSCSSSLALRSHRSLLRVVTRRLTRRGHG
jgi:hypothetical protein